MPRSVPVQTGVERIEQGLGLAGEVAQGPVLEGGAQPRLGQQVREDLLAALGEEAQIAREGVGIVPAGGEQELQRPRLGQAVVVLNVGDSVSIQADSGSDAPIVDASSISTGQADPDPVATTPDTATEDTDTASEV